MDNFVQGEFDSYLRDVVPVGAPPAQIAECKRAFFAGAHALLSAFIAIGEDSVTEEAGVEWLESIQAELSTFKEDVLAGRA
jgi:hypothetical protein